MDDLVGRSAVARGANERGIIAQHYHELQSLDLVEAARAARAMERASEESWIRTVLQAAEIGLYNMADVLARAAQDLGASDLDGCATKLSWLRGFHRVLTRLSAATTTYTHWRTASRPDSHHLVRVADSPALGEYLVAQRQFDAALRSWWDTSKRPPEAALAAERLPSARFSILHLARIINHEATIWERPLVAVQVPSVSGPYAEFVASPTLREAVHEHELTGDTYFMQFRGLHQIPELIGAEINDLLEGVIVAVRADEAQAASAALMAANLLTSAVDACLPVLVDNLATHDYHEIRENLGLTSGSHSVGIRYHMFTHLYEQLCEEVAAYAQRRRPGADGVPDAVRGVMSAGPGDSGFGGLMCQVMAFRTFIFTWRDQHIHLPRNNLGGGGTRSLTGSPDAIAVVAGMMEHARATDPAHAFYADPAALGDDRPGRLATFLQGPDSTDTELMAATGRLTQESFVDVQHRLGFFANRCQFVKPPRRVV